MKKEDIQYGKYQHYKTQKYYEVIGVGLHSETKEEMVIYKALYFCEKFGDYRIWVRSKKMFLEAVEYNGNRVPRFQYISE